MKILLIGKNGQLGAEINRQSLERKYEINAFGREELDITDSNKVNQEIESYKPDIVINASAFQVVPACEIEPEQAFLVNAISLKSLAEFCEEKNIRLVTYSTDYVFD